MGSSIGTMLSSFNLNAGGMLGGTMMNEAGGHLQEQSEILLANGLIDQKTALFLKKLGTIIQASGANRVSQENIAWKERLKGIRESKSLAACLSQA